MKSLAKRRLANPFIRLPVVRGPDRFTTGSSPGDVISSFNGCGFADMELECDPVSCMSKEIG